MADANGGSPLLSQGELLYSSRQAVGAFFPGESLPRAAQVKERNTGVIGLNEHI